MVVLILVVAAFGAVLGNMFSKTPAIASAYIFKIIAALILGVLLYRVKMNFTFATLIGIVMLCFALWLGTKLPVKFSYYTWMYIIHKSKRFFFT